MMKQAHYIDNKYPNLSLDAQFAKLVVEEKNMYSASELLYFG